MPTKYCIDGANISCYLIGEPGSGTESLIPEGVTPMLQNYDEIKASLAPGQLFEDPYFPAVESSIAYNPTEKDNELEHLDEIEWLRPAEILKAKGKEGTPLFIDNGGDPEKVGCPDDVNQNLLGDCWFLCSMAELSRLPDVFWMVVCKENVTQFDAEEYRGIFKFRFAAFGRLVEVVIDDRIPYRRSEESSGHWSVEADNPRVFWSALMEKAYAKLYSSYQAIQGGWIGDALQDFTGGVIDRYDEIEELNSKKLWRIIEDANKARFYMGASVGKTFDDPAKEEAWTEETGLGNQHAYSLLTCKELSIHGVKYRLLRLRNPWGNAYEFKGKFNEETGKLWKKLDDETKKEFPAGEDGEFWMTLGEFQKNVALVEIVNLNPFGSGGKSLEELCEDVNFSRLLKDGEWTEDNCFGALGGDEEEDEDGDDAKDEEENEAVEDEEDAGTESDAAEDADADEDDEDQDSEADIDEDALPEDEEEEDKEYTAEDYETFSKNPQIKFTVPKIALNDEGKSQVVISLFQRYRRNLKKTGKDEVYIGMAVAKIENEYPVTGSEMMDSEEFQDLEGGEYRSHTVRIDLTPGDYVVIPYNKDKTLGGFTVIVFTKK